jgi:hypothetical protein
MRFRPIRAFKRWSRDNPHDFIVGLIIVIISAIGLTVMLYAVPKSGMLVIKPDQIAPAGAKKKGG